MCLLKAARFSKRQSRLRASVTFAMASRGGSNLKQRIKRILDQTMKHKPSSKAENLLVLVVVLAVFTPLASVIVERSHAQQSGESSDEAKVIVRKDTLSTATLPDVNDLADGFDFPVGSPNGGGYIVKRGFEEDGHIGDDWCRIAGGPDAALGDPIYSIGAGRVVFAEDVKRGWGKVVICRHDYLDQDGERKTIDALYSGLERIDVKKGDHVRRRQRIGTIGTAGGLYRAHLHFEIRKNTNIMLKRSGFARDRTNYHNPSEFIRTHRPKK